MSNADLAARVIADLPRYDISVRPGASPAALEAFEHRFSVTMPPDMLQFYSRVNGMKEYATWTAEWISLWTLDRIKPIPEVLPEDHYAAYRSVPDAQHRFVFADLMIRCDLYAIHIPPTPSDDWPVISVCGGHDVRASSFSDFVRRCLDEPETISS